MLVEVNVVRWSASLDLSVIRRSQLLPGRGCVPPILHHTHLGQDSGSRSISAILPLHPLSPSPSPSPKPEALFSAAASSSHPPRRIGTRNAKPQGT
ncbi:hypothetical protein ZWY2020_018950 [Hordeum vulgare]|nr:hypothetical protein ZWY2020_018950 [Hordeum vulgare]